MADANQIKYLTNLLNTGDYGQKEWAKAQLSLIPAETATTTNLSPSATINDQSTVPTVTTNAAATPSLIPPVPQTAAVTLSAPVYTPYKAKEFDDSVSGGPGSDLGWNWQKGIKSKQLWDTEQAQRLTKPTRIIRHF